MRWLQNACNHVNLFPSVQFKNPLQLRFLFCDLLQTYWKPIYTIFDEDFNWNVFYLTGHQTSYRYTVEWKVSEIPVLSICIYTIIILYTVHWTRIGNQMLTLILRVQFCDIMMTFQFTNSVLPNRLWFPLCKGAFCCWNLDCIRVECSHNAECTYLYLPISFYFDLHLRAWASDQRNTITEVKQPKWGLSTCWLCSVCVAQWGARHPRVPPVMLLLLCIQRSQLRLFGTW